MKKMKELILCCCLGKIILLEKESCWDLWKNEETYGRRLDSWGNRRTQSHSNERALEQPIRKEDCELDWWTQVGTSFRCVNKSFICYLQNSAFWKNHNGNSIFFLQNLALSRRCKTSSMTFTKSPRSSRISKVWLTRIWKKSATKLMKSKRLSMSSRRYASF